MHISNNGNKEPVVKSMTNDEHKLNHREQLSSEIEDAIAAKQVVIDKLIDALEEAIKEADTTNGYLGFNCFRPIVISSMKKIIEEAKDANIKSK